MTSPRKAIAMLAACLVYYSLMLAGFTAYVWLMLGGGSLYDALTAAIKLLCAFVAALLAAAFFNAAWRRYVSKPSDGQGG